MIEDVRLGPLFLFFAWAGVGVMVLVFAAEFAGCVVSGRKERGREGGEEGGGDEGLPAYSRDDKLPRYTAKVSGGGWRDQGAVSAEGGDVYRLTGIYGPFF